jgi:hypothetical protein
MRRNKSTSQLIGIRRRRGTLHSGQQRATAGLGPSSIWVEEAEGLNKAEDDNDNIHKISLMTGMRVKREQGIQRLLQGQGSTDSE